MYSPGTTLILPALVPPGSTHVTLMACTATTHGYGYTQNMHIWPFQGARRRTVGVGVPVTLIKPSLRLKPVLEAKALP